MANRSIKRNKRSNKRRYKSKKMYNQRGGLNFSNVQKTRLQELGFTQAQVTQVEELFGDMSPVIAMIHIQTDRANGITPQEIIQNLLDVNQELENAEEHEYFNGENSPKSVVPGNYGGKRRSKKSRKSRKMRGGARFGTGVGANNSDPNYSIFNTRALSLFPYKPN